MNVDSNMVAVEFERTHEGKGVNVPDWGEGFYWKQLDTPSAAMRFTVDWGENKRHTVRQLVINLMSIALQYGIEIGALHEDAGELPFIYRVWLEMPRWFWNMSDVREALDAAVERGIIVVEM